MVLTYMAAGRDMEGNLTCLPQTKSGYLEKWMSLPSLYHYGVISIIHYGIRIGVKLLGPQLALFSVGYSQLFSRLIVFPSNFQDQSKFKMVITKPIILPSNLYHVDAK